MGPIWGRQDPGGPHVGPNNFAIWVILTENRHILIEISMKFVPEGSVDNRLLLI